jgi:hypothetical protein
LLALPSIGADVVIYDSGKEALAICHAWPWTSRQGGCVLAQCWAYNAVLWCESATKLLEDDRLEWHNLHTHQLCHLDPAYVTPATALIATLTASDVDSDTLYERLIQLLQGQCLPADSVIRDLSHLQKLGLKHPLHLHIQTVEPSNNQPSSWLAARVSDATAITIHASPPKTSSTVTTAFVGLTQPLQLLEEWIRYARTRELYCTLHGNHCLGYRWRTCPD